MSNITLRMRWADVRSLTQPSCWLDVAHFGRLGLQIAATGTRRGQHICFAIEGSESGDDGWPTIWEELDDDYVGTGFRTTAPHLWTDSSTIRKVYLDRTPDLFRYVRIRPRENQLAGKGAQLLVLAFEVPG